MFSLLFRYVILLRIILNYIDCITNNIIVCFLLILQRMLIHIFNFLKLNICFEGSIYQIKHYLVILFSIILFLFFIGYCVFTYITTKNMDECESTKYVSILGIIYGLIYIILSFGITYMFVKRLTGVLSITMDQPMYIIVNKVSTLGITCIISTLIFIILPSIFGFYTSPYKFYGLDLIFSNLTLLLQFHKSNKLYALLCCFNINCVRLGNTQKQVLMRVTSKSPTSPTLQTSPSKIFSKAFQKYASDTETKSSQNNNNNTEGKSTKQQTPINEIINTDKRINEGNESTTKDTILIENISELGKSDSNEISSTVGDVIIDSLPKFITKYSAQKLSKDDSIASFVSNFGKNKSHSGSAAETDNDISSDQTTNDHNNISTTPKCITTTPKSTTIEMSNNISVKHLSIVIVDDDPESIKKITPKLCNHALKDLGIIM